MSIFFIFGIAISLALDAFAVSIVNGIIIKNLKIKHALLIALSFGIFQAIMPLIGWSAGSYVSGYLLTINKWIAFVLLTIIGIHMIYESFQIETDKCDRKSCLHFPTLIILSIATSIDALAVGFSIGVIKEAILIPIIIIGCVTFVMSFSGVYIGKNFGHFAENKLEIIGGVILILIGLKTLIF